MRAGRAGAGGSVGPDVRLGDVICQTSRGLPHSLADQTFVGKTGFEIIRIILSIWSGGATSAR
jgi:hypothetical protein